MDLKEQQQQSFESTGSEEEASAGVSGGRSMRSKVTKMFSHLSLDSSDAATAVDLLRSGNMKVLTAMHQKLKKCDSEWIDDFLDEDGFQVRRIHYNNIKPPTCTAFYFFLVQILIFPVEFKSKG